MPGLHSILYPPGPGKAMVSLPSRNMITLSFSFIDLQPKMAGKSEPHPSATFALNWSEDAVPLSPADFIAIGIIASSSQIAGSDPTPLTFSLLETGN